MYIYVDYSLVDFPRLPKIQCLSKLTTKTPGLSLYSQSVDPVIDSKRPVVKFYCTISNTKKTFLFLAWIPFLVF